MRAKPVTIRGTSYTSIRAAAAALGVHPNAVRKAARRGTLDRVGAGPQCKPTTVKGVTFPSQIAAARYLGLSQTGMNSAVARDRLATAGITREAARLTRLKQAIIALHEAKLGPMMLATAKAEEAERRGRQKQIEGGVAARTCAVCGAATTGEAVVHRACRAMVKAVALAAE